MPRVQIGLEHLISSQQLTTKLKGKRIGLLCNQASVDSRLIHAKDLLGSVCNLTSLFSPQHGLYATEQDNMIESSHGVQLFESGRIIPVFSLYEKKREPSAEQLAMIDVMVIDLQDVGTRVYTFIWTLLLTMQACAKAGVSVLVLDRPNPIGGVKIEGNLLRMENSSFVGMAPIPMRHGLTIGELACYFKALQCLDLELDVIPMQGWSRKMLFPDTELPWIWPSPNMPCFETSLVYPGQVLLEGTNISEGRGTTKPFEVFGAPFLDCNAIQRRLEVSGIKGFYLRTQFFAPTFHKWHGKTCQGFQLHVIEPDTFEPYLFSLTFLSIVANLNQEDFEWKQPPYEYEYEKLPIDMIIGDSVIREAVEVGASAQEIKTIWEREECGYREKIERFLLYR